MKIISIVWYKVLPPVFGGQKGIADFNNHLSKQHPLVCLCSHNNLATDAVSYTVIPQLPVGKKQFLSPFTWKKIKTVAASEKATHIIAEHPYHGISAVKTAKALKLSLIIHSHNIESQRFKQMGKWWWRLLHYYEGWVYRKADIVLFKTHADKNFAIHHFNISPAKTMVVPYGIEKNIHPGHKLAAEMIRYRHGIHPDEKLLLFAGTLDYLPNAKAVKDIYQEIAPRLKKENLPFKIIICGRNEDASFQSLKKLSHPDIIYTGEVADIHHYFSAADAFINPVCIGGGTQTKNIEALSHHSNIVCFKEMVDAELLALVKNKLFIAAGNNWENFVEQVKLALDKRTDTPEEFFEQYSWERIITNLSERMNAI